MNWWLFFVVALVPMLVGAIYYHPKVVGGIWMRANGLNEEKLKQGNMAVILGLAYLFSLLVAVSLAQAVIHQMGIGSLLGSVPGWLEEGSAVMNALAEFDEATGIMTLHRSFGHGALHGAFTAILFAGGIIAINALFERRRWNYVLVHVGYWTITLALMGGVLCEFLTFDA